MFDSRTQFEIKGYVYLLIDPRNNTPFYVGKGHGNRVFDHAKGAISSDCPSERLQVIRSILNEGHEVNHVILRHGLTNSECFLLETAVIDVLKYNSIGLTNLVNGHLSSAFGLMSSKEIKRKYESKPLESLPKNVMLMNINRRFDESKNGMSLFGITSGSWVMAKHRTNSIEFVLAEYRGFIVEVFAVKEWHSASDRRYQFTGGVAHDNIRKDFINKKVEKKRGAANPVRFNL